MKVLVAENNPQVLQQLCDILDKEGYNTIPATNGSVALEAWSQHSPDFVCLDIMMPDLSGYDVCREIRKTDLKTPIVFATYGPISDVAPAALPTKRAVLVDCWLAQITSPLTH